MSSLPLPPTPHVPPPPPPACRHAGSTRELHILPCLSMSPVRHEHAVAFNQLGSRAAWGCSSEGAKIERAARTTDVLVSCLRSISLPGVPTRKKTRFHPSCKASSRGDAHHSCRKISGPPHLFSVWLSWKISASLQRTCSAISLSLLHPCLVVPPLSRFSRPSTDGDSTRNLSTGVACTPRKTVSGCARNRMGCTRSKEKQREQKGQEQETKKRSAKQHTHVRDSYEIWGRREGDKKERCTSTNQSLRKCGVCQRKQWTYAYVALLRSG